MLVGLCPLLGLFSLTKAWLVIVELSSVLMTVPPWCATIVRELRSALRVTPGNERLVRNHSLERNPKGNVVHERQAGIQDRYGHTRSGIDSVDARRWHIIGDVKSPAAINGKAHYPH